MELGVRIRKMRLKLGMTQQEIADLCGFTKSLLSKIENGSVIPPIATLSKLAKAFGVRLSALLEEDGGRLAAFEKNVFAESGLFTRTDKGYSIYAPAAEYVNKKMQPVLVIVEKGKVKEHELAHEGEEYIYVLKGEIRFKVANTEYRLKEGESLYFDAIQAHGVEAITEMAWYLDMVVE
jgi:transcriptional regulator with XRE-family HTH domain